MSTSLTFELGIKLIFRLKESITSIERLRSMLKSSFKKSFSNVP